MAVAELAARAGSRDIDLLTGSVLGGNRRALAAVFPGMRYVVRIGAYQVRAPLRTPPHDVVAGRVA